MCSIVSVCSIAGEPDAAHLSSSSVDDTNEHGFEVLDRPSFGGLKSVENAFIKSDVSANNSDVSYNPVAQKLMV